MRPASQSRARAAARCRDHTRRSGSRVPSQHAGSAFGARGGVAGAAARLHTRVMPRSCANEQRSRPRSVQRVVRVLVDANTLGLGPPSAAAAVAAIGGRATPAAARLRRTTRRFPLSAQRHSPVSGKRGCGCDAAVAAAGKRALAGASYEPIQPRAWRARGCGRLAARRWLERADTRRSAPARPPWSSSWSRRRRAHELLAGAASPKSSSSPPPGSTPGPTARAKRSPRRTAASWS